MICVVGYNKGLRTKEKSMLLTIHTRRIYLFLKSTPPALACIAYQSSVTSHCLANYIHCRALK